MRVACLARYVLFVVRFSLTPYNLGQCYALSRPLTETEWNTLRGYTRRVWSIHRFVADFGSLDQSTLRVLFTLAPFADPLFPNLRSLFWKDFTTLPVMHTAVPSLTSLYLNFKPLTADASLPTKFLDAVGTRCSNMKSFRVSYSPPGPLDAAISRQVFLWSNLQALDCDSVTLSIDLILRLPSASTLTWLSFTLSADLDNHVLHFAPALTFPNLTILEVYSSSLEAVTALFSRIQLPVITGFSVIFTNDASKRNIEAYWTTIRKTCPSNTLAHLMLYHSGEGIQDSTDSNEQGRPQLMLDSLPFKTFGGLYTIHINFPWSVKLTDADLIDLVSTSPFLEGLVINNAWGWRMDDDDDGITLTGLVRLLRRCPSLHNIGLAVNTRTFTHIPHDLDMSFLPRKSLSMNLLDSYISFAFVTDLVRVFTSLKLGPPTRISAWTDTGGGRDQEDMRTASVLWKCVVDGIEGMSAL